MNKEENPLYTLTLQPVDGGLEAYGFDKIAYVENPAIEEMGVFLSTVEGVEIDKKGYRGRDFKLLKNGR